MKGQLGDRTTGEQLDYYRARAPEYDEWWFREGRYDRGEAANAQWFAESRQAADAMTSFRPSGQILELACGTGIWSEKLLPFAQSLTLLDGSAEMLDLARRRLGSDRITFIQADIFNWEPAARFDTVFFSFWLSHVPPALFAPFWALVGRCLAPNGRVFFVDSRHEPTSTATDHTLPDRNAQTLLRKLNDSREFRIYKIFHDPATLETQLAAMGWRFSIAATGKYFIHGEGRMSSGSGPG